MDDEAKKNSTGKDSRLLDTVKIEMNNLGCPASADKIPATVDKLLKGVKDP